MSAPTRADIPYPEDNKPERGSSLTVVASCLNTRMSSPREPFAALANLVNHDQLTFSPNCFFCLQLVGHCTYRPSAAQMDKPTNYQN